MGNRLLPALLVALLLIFLQLRSGADTSFVVVIAAMATFSYVTIATGRLLLGAAGVHGSDPSAAYVMGLLATCLGIYALTVLFSITAGVAFGVVALIAVGLDLVYARRHPGQPPDWRALIGFALCVAFTAAWCSGPAGAYEVVRTEGVLPVWSDYFFHGSILSQFGDVRAVGRQSILLADVPSTFYHFGSYGAAAALTGLLDQPGLALATSVWMPLGFLAMTVGAYALGERLAGAAGGLAALAAVAILPDASNYGLHNGYLSFHWSLMAHPGATYGLGAAFLSLAFLDRWNRESATAALLASGVLAASIVFLRAHVFLLLVPAWAATIAYCRASERARKQLVGIFLVVALGIAGAAVSLMLSQFVQTDPSLQWRFGEPALPKFLTEVHVGSEPTAYTGVYGEALRWNPWWYSLAVGVLLVIFAALGAFAILPAGAAILAHRCGKLRPIDVFPEYLAYCWLLLLLFAPVTWHLQGTELIDRSLVLLYASAVIWTPCLLLRWLAMKSPRLQNASWPAMLVGMVAALPVTVASTDRMAQPKFSWGLQYTVKRVEPGLVEAAAFLRNHARSGDIFAAGGLDTSHVPFDLPTQFCSLSGVPTYLSRPYLEMIKDAPRKLTVAMRLAGIEEMEKQETYGKAMQFLQRLNVQWYVVAGEKGPLWDPQRERAAFRAERVALYTTGK
ncbi:MAG: hypothetical protein EPO19_07940 [Betaproteobacteria bacterium]|nr:MAG: hypothetical protein EPO19_07940 [Betaproteobacteria bacterium]